MPVLLTFRSKASAQICMYKTHIAPVLAQFGKSTDRGVITADELENAIAQLEKLMEQHRQADQMLKQENFEIDIEAVENETDSAQKSITPSVPFATRMYPFMSMLKQAQNAHADIVWGI